jgi:uncharacterized membrane protein HdeD (DUF308 family)
MAEKTQRSELNYLIAGALLLLGGGYVVNLSQSEDSTPGVVVGAVLLIAGLALIVRGITRGRR